MGNGFYLFSIPLSTSHKPLSFLYIHQPLFRSMLQARNIRRVAMLLAQPNYIYIYNYRYAYNINWGFQNGILINVISSVIRILHQNITFFFPISIQTWENLNILMKKYLYIIIGSLLNLNNRDKRKNSFRWVWLRDARFWAQIRIHKIHRIIKKLEVYRDVLSKLYILHPSLC